MILVQNSMLIKNHRNLGLKINRNRFTHLRSFQILWSWPSSVSISSLVSQCCFDVNLLTSACTLKLFSIYLFTFLLAHFFPIWHKKLLFNLLMPFSIYSLIMAVALDNISLLRIGTSFMVNHQECIRWFWQYGLLAKQVVCPICIWHGSFLWKIALAIVANTWPYCLWCRSAEKSRGVSVADDKYELQIWSEHSIGDWNQYCRNAAVLHFINNPAQIGDPRYNSWNRQDLIFVKKIHEIMILKPCKTFCCQSHIRMLLLWCLSPYTGSGQEQKFEETWVAYNDIAARGFQPVFKHPI